MIHIPLEYIPQYLDCLCEWLGEPSIVNHGRDLNGYKTKANYQGPGWRIWSNHQRVNNHQIIFSYLEFSDPKLETFWCLVNPDPLKLPKTPS